MARKLILVIDDDPTARQILHRNLKSKYDVLPVGDAITGLAEARKQTPDLILLDLGLPGGGGLSVLERLHSLPRLSGTPVIVISGQERAKAEPAALQAGAVAFFQKPADPEALLAVIADVLGED
jgi:two-component system chemotaxis response regulator CheY